MSAIEVGMHVHQHRPHLAAAQINAWMLVGPRRSGGHHARELLALDQQINQHNAVVAIGLRAGPRLPRAGPRLPQHAERHARIGDPIGGGIGPDKVGELGPHRRHGYTARSSLTLWRLGKRLFASIALPIRQRRSVPVWAWPCATPRPPGWETPRGARVRGRLV